MKEKQIIKIMSKGKDFDFPNNKIMLWDCIDYINKEVHWECRGIFVSYEWYIKYNEYSLSLLYKWKDLTKDLFNPENEEALDYMISLIQGEYG